MILIAVRYVLPSNPSVQFSRQVKSWLMEHLWGQCSALHCLCVYILHASTFLPLETCMLSLFSFEAKHFCFVFTGLLSLRVSCQLYNGLRGMATTVDKALLSKLRKRTGISFINCKKALEQFENDLEKVCCFCGSKSES